MCIPLWPLTGTNLAVSLAGWDKWYQNHDLSTNRPVLMLELCLKPFWKAVMICSWIQIVLGVMQLILASLMVVKLFFDALWWDIQIPKTRFSEKFSQILSWLINFYHYLNANASIKAFQTQSKWTFHFSSPKMCAVPIWPEWPTMGRHHLPMQLSIFTRAPRPAIGGHFKLYRWNGTGTGYTLWMMMYMLS